LRSKTTSELDQFARDIDAPADSELLTWCRASLRHIGDDVVSSARILTHDLSRARALLAGFR